jgi:hypothetical protein
VKRELFFPEPVLDTLAELEASPGDAGLLKQIRKALAYLEHDTKHPSLHTHEFVSKKGPAGERIWEAYAQNDTPNAYRILFFYGPDRTHQGRRVPVLTIFAIIPHP